MNASELIPLILAIVIIVGVSVGIFLLLGKLPMRFAARYLFSKKKQNTINIITMVSIFGIMIVTAALVIILSIFNGFQFLIEDLFASFDPDVKVVAEKGRTMPYDAELELAMFNVEGVEQISGTIENKAMIRYYDNQHIVLIKGVKEDYHQKIKALNELVYDGEYYLGQRGDLPTAVLGGGVADFINASLRDYMTPMEIFVASEKSNLLTDLEGGLRTEKLYAEGYFSVQIEYDNKFVLVDFETAERLFEMDGLITAYEIKLSPDAKASEVKEKLETLLGSGFEIQTGYEQHKTLFDVMKNEKRVAYLVLVLVLLLAAVNIVGGLSMIVLEKTRDIAILKSYGATKNMIGKIFLAEGFLVGLIGGLGGSLIGFIIGFVQMTFGVVKLGGGDSFLIEAYPLRLDPWDFVLIYITVFTMALLAAWFPARNAAKTNIIQAMRS